MDQPVDDTVMSPREKKRADAFVFDRDAGHYRAARVLQRLVLAAYTGIAPEALSFSTVARGKPTLAEHDLEFNMTDSGGFALIALTLNRPVGFDLEAPREMPDALDIARRYFHPLERAEIFALPDPESRLRAFFHCWTRKEAYMKAVGEGLYLSLESFAVEVCRHDNPALLDCAEGAEEARHWTLADLSVDDNLFGALAIRGKVDEIMYWSRSLPFPP